MQPNELNELSNPALMRAARGAYAQSINTELHAVGIDDLPRNGAFILARIGSPTEAGLDLPSALGITKQAVGLVIDALVNRGYVTRDTDPGDRRRIDLSLTDRGRVAAEAVYRAVEAVDQQLETQVSPEQVEAMRAGLIALATIKATATTATTPGRGGRRRDRALRHFSPIFPVRDLAAGLAHYQSLGFTTFPYDGGDDYGFANRDGIGVHLALAPEGHKAGPGSTYLYVRDADALYEEWSRPGIGGHTHPVEVTPYDLREGSHVDPDGNLIRFGSPIEE
jgi:DNA-binding MarR family transcriptional regulator